jgi:hypothetical protein
VENGATVCRALMDGAGFHEQIDDIPWLLTVLIESTGASSRNPFPSP